MITTRSQAIASRRDVYKRQEQACGWDKTIFDGFLKDIPPDDDRDRALKTLREAFGLEPMDEPYEYIKGVQEGFDYRKLRFKKDYYEWAPEEPLVPTPPLWRVYYNNGFFASGGRSRPGQEISTNIQFDWLGRTWLIPAVYFCARGLVADYCIEVPAKSLKDYMEKWDLREDGELGRKLDEEESMTAENENPLAFDFASTVKLGKNVLKWRHGNSMVYAPALTNSDMREAEWLMDHYGLDKSSAWCFWRVSYPWATKSKPKLGPMEITLHNNPKKWPGTRFSTPEPGSQMTLRHPLTGCEYTLHIQSVEQTELDRSHLRDEAMEYPTHFTQMARCV